MEIKKYMIIYKLNSTMTREVRMHYIEARSTLEAVMLHFENCPYTCRFDLLSVTEVTDRFVDYHKISTR